MGLVIAKRISLVQTLPGLSIDERGMSKLLVPSVLLSALALVYLHWLARDVEARHYWPQSWPKQMTSLIEPATMP